ncbi:MAG: DUF349 domain-containing protein [Lentisphaeria bacterium]|nr:DUF349 domain-containing protein [Lentisphaeria bacterium]
MSEQIENPQTDRAASGGMSGELREHLHRREEVCRRLETLPQTAVEDYSAQLEMLRTEWSSLPEVPPEYAEILDKRFAAAVKAAEEAAAEAEARRRSRLAKINESAALHQELDNLLAAGELVVPAEVEALGRKWEACTAGLSDEESAAEAFMAKFSPLRERMAAEQAAEDARSEAAVKLTEELVTLTAGEDMDLLKERKTAIEAEYAAIGKVAKAAADKYNDAHRKAATKLAQHYETLDLARWESFTLKQDLCNELDRLIELPEAELPKAAKRLQELREKWKQLGAVPKSKADEINPRYLEATRKLQHRVDEYYAHLRQQHKQAAAAKQELCDKAVALAESTEWNATAAAFKELQTAWKAIPGAGAQEKALFTAFRASADKFFNARSAWFDERNAKFETVAGVKRKLLAEAEQLAEQSGDSPAAVQRAKQLRSEYMAAGRAGRAEQEISEKFNAALDKFFSGRREVFAGREEQAKKLIAEIDELAANLTDTAAADSRYRAIRRELKELGCRKTFQQEIKAGEKFEAALGAAKTRVLTDKLTLAKSVARSLAAAWEEVKSGAPLEEGRLAVENLDRFPKLAAAAALIGQAAAGDEKAKEKLNKAFDSAAAEHKRIITELEKLVGIESKEEEKPAADDAMSLAAELTAAIAGNFAASNARAEARAKIVDPKQLLSEFVNAGLLESTALEASFERFDNAYGKLR